jgi:DNA (cytosine-5)-methyltransferase 1
MSDLILSLFPGIDLLGLGFEGEGYCVVRGPDLIWGWDIRTFHPPDDKFDGVIGGSPCQDFSKIRRSPPTGYGVEMLREFIRVIDEAKPKWFLLENVPSVPDILVDGYIIQRLDLNARECGSLQNRPRHFQFGSIQGIVIVPVRVKNPPVFLPAVLATEGNSIKRRSWSEFCELQGLSKDYDLPGFSRSAKYKAVGNGVNLLVAKTLARAIREAYKRHDPIKVCGCNCGRIITGKQEYATAACRKRMERRRKRDPAGGVTAREVT